MVLEKIVGTTPAPMLSKGAISGVAPGVAQSASDEKRKQAEREWVTSAVGFGAALEDLVVQARLEENEQNVAPQMLGRAQFPPDLFYRINPQTLLWNTYQKLLKLEEILLKAEHPDGLPGPDGPKASGLGGTRPQRPLPPAATRQPQQPGPGGMWQTRQQPGSSETQQQPTPPPDGVQQPTLPPRPDEMQPPRSEEAQPSGSSGTTPSGSQPPQLPQSSKPNGTQPPGLVDTEPQPAPGGPEPPSPDETRPSAPAATRQPQQQLGPGGKPRLPLRPGGAPSLGAPPLPVPSKEANIKEKIEELLKAYAGGARGSELDPYLSGPNGVDAAICNWDAHIVERIVDFPAVFSGYRVGKALSLTRWKIREAERQRNSVDDNPSVDPWSEAFSKAFSKKRIDEIKRHVSVLSTVLDSQAVAVVTTSLGYWREALLSLTSITESASTRSRARWRRVLQKISTLREPSNVGSAQLAGERTIRISPEHGGSLRTALEEQVTSWLDVLTQRRPLESFPVVGIVTALTKKMAATLWKRLIRYAIIIGVSVAVLLVLGTLIAVAIMVVHDFQSGNRSLDWQGLLASIGTAFGAIFTFIVVQSRGLFNRNGGDEDPREMGYRASRWGGYGTGSFMNMFWRSSYGIRGSMGGPSLKQNALSNVVEQIQLEEYNLAVSDPLVRCFLALTGQESTKGDPQENAERFLRSVYGDRSNLDRLLPAFKDLYKH